MSTKPIIGNVTIGGVAKTMSDGDVNVNGVWKPLYKTYTNVGGAWKDAWESLFVWKKYKCTETVTYEMKTDKNASKLSFYSYAYVTLYKTYTYNSSDGTFTVPTASNQIATARGSEIGSLRYSYPYYKDSGTEISEITSSGNYYNNYYSYSRTLYYSEKVTSYSQGTYIEDVTSDNETAYPENGRHTDGYWYVKQ